MKKLLTLLFLIGGFAIQAQTFNFGCSGPSREGQGLIIQKNSGTLNAFHITRFDRNGHGLAPEGWINRLQYKGPDGEWRSTRHTFGNTGVLDPSTGYRRIEIPYEHILNDSEYQLEFRLSYYYGSEDNPNLFRDNGGAGGVSPSTAVSYDTSYTDVYRFGVNTQTDSAGSLRLVVAVNPNEGSNAPDIDADRVLLISNTGDRRIINTENLHEFRGGPSIIMTDEQTGFEVGTRIIQIINLYPDGSTDLVGNGPGLISIRANFASTNELSLEVDQRGGDVDTFFKNQWNEVHYLMGTNQISKMEYRILRGNGIGEWIELFNPRDFRSTPGSISTHSGTSDQFSAVDRQREGLFVVEGTNNANDLTRGFFGDSRVQVRTTHWDFSTNIKEVNINRHQAVNIGSSSSSGVDQCGDSFYRTSIHDHNDLLHSVQDQGIWVVQAIRGASSIDQLVRFTAGNFTDGFYRLQLYQSGDCDRNVEFALRGSILGASQNTGYRIVSPHIAGNSRSGNNSTLVVGVGLGETQNLTVGTTVKVVRTDGALGAWRGRVLQFTDSQVTIEDITNVLDPTMTGAEHLILDGSANAVFVTHDNTTFHSNRLPSN